MADTTIAYRLPREKQIRDLVERARQGDRNVLPELSSVLDSHPEIWESISDLARLATESLVDLAAGQDEVLRESLNRKIDKMKREFQYEGAGLLERMIIDRVIVSWIQSAHADAMLGQTKGVGLEQARFLEARSDRTHRAHLTAVKYLATVRKILAQTGKAMTASVPSTTANKN